MTYLADNPQGTTVTSDEVLHGNLAADTAALTQLDDLHSALLRLLDSCRAGQWTAIHHRVLDCQLCLVILMMQ
jgi:hypothetical protein